MCSLIRKFFSLELVTKKIFLTLLIFIAPLTAAHASKDCPKYNNGLYARDNQNLNTLEKRMANALKIIENSPINATRKRSILSFDKMRSSSTEPCNGGAKRKRIISTTSYDEENGNSSDSESSDQESNTSNFRAQRIKE